MLSGCLNCPGLDALESFLEELVDDESENISYNVCMYVLHLYPALSQKRSNDGRVCYDLHYLQNEGNAKENR
jgi:hypothetical protein